MTMMTMMIMEGVKEEEKPKTHLRALPGPSTTTTIKETIKKKNPQLAQMEDMSLHGVLAWMNCKIGRAHV